MLQELKSPNILLYALYQDKAELSEFYSIYSFQIQLQAWNFMSFQTIVRLKFFLTHFTDSFQFNNQMQFLVFLKYVFSSKYLFACFALKYYIRIMQVYCFCFSQSNSNNTKLPFCIYSFRIQHLNINRVI